MWLNVLLLWTNCRRDVVRDLRSCWNEPILDLQFCVARRLTDMNWLWTWRLVLLDVLLQWTDCRLDVFWGLTSYCNELIVDVTFCVMWRCVWLHFLLHSTDSCVTRRLTAMNWLLTWRCVWLDVLLQWTDYRRDDVCDLMSYCIELIVDVTFCEAWRLIAMNWL